MRNLVADGWRILRAGVFMHSAYAAHHLGARRWTPVALLHFLLRGEARGYRANPFLDPALRDGAGRRLRLADYCRNTGGRLPASKTFDPAWYAARHGVGDAHPFVHFWQTGFDENLDPAPGFDLAFVKEVVAVFRPDKTEYLYERMAAAPDFPRSEAELAARQDAFYAAVTMRVLRATPTARRFLLFVQAAHDYAHPYGGDRGFDVLLNVYDGRPPVDPDAAEIVVMQNGTKATAIRKLLEAAPDLLLRYEAVLFLDDDIVIAGTAVEALFATMVGRGLDLAQPALTPDSECAYAILKQPVAGSGVRPVSMVEIMMPVVSRRALRACGTAFAGAISGWGVDGLLAGMVRARFGDTIALCADIVAAHRRGVDVEGGAFYRYLRVHGLEPAHEIALLARRHGISPWPDAARFL